MTSDTYTPRNQAGTRFVPGGISARNRNNTTSEWVQTGLFVLVLSYAAMLLVPAFVQAIEPTNAVSDPIIAFRQLGDGLAHVRSSQYHFYRVDGTSITITAHSPAVSSSLPRGTIQAQSNGGGI